MFSKINKIKSLFSTNIIKNSYNSSSATDEKIKNARDNKYDNLRGLVIISIVFVHLIEPFLKISSFHSIYNLLIVFNLPLLFFISGYFSKVSIATPIKAFKRLFIPFVFFSMVWIVIFFILHIRFSEIPLFYPSPGLWFLLSLFTMRLLISILSEIRYVFWIALLIALLVGIFDFPENFLSITRTFCFLPVFLVGYNFKYYKNIFKHEIMPKLKFLRIFRNKNIILLSLIVFLLAIGLYVYYIPSGAMIFKVPYSSLHMGIFQGIIVRTIIIISGIIISLLLIFLMTSKKMFLTKIGINSLSVYILHFYFTHFYFIRAINIKFIQSNFSYSIDLILWVYAIIATFILVYTLSRDIVTKAINKLTEIVSSIVLKNNEF